MRQVPDLNIRFFRQDWPGWQRLPLAATPTLCPPRAEHGLNASFICRSSDESRRTAARGRRAVPRAVAEEPGGRARAAAPRLQACLRKAGPRAARERGGVCRAGPTAHHGLMPRDGRGILPSWPVRTTWYKPGQRAREEDSEWHDADGPAPPRASHIGRLEVIHLFRGALPIRHRRDRLLQPARPHAQPGARPRCSAPPSAVPI